MRRNIEDIKKLNTKNLLRFFKAERTRFYKSGYRCDCGCGELLTELYPDDEKLAKTYAEHKAYLDEVKEELNTRGHVG